MNFQPKPLYDFMIQWKVPEQLFNIFALIALVLKKKVFIEFSGVGVLERNVKSPSIFITYYDCTVLNETN